METTQEHPLDLVWGVQAIARLIGRTERQTYHLCATGAIPVRKVGATWMAERGKLIKFFLDDAA